MGITAGSREGPVTRDNKMMMMMMMMMMKVVMIIIIINTNVNITIVAYNRTYNSLFNFFIRTVYD